MGQHSSAPGLGLGTGSHESLPPLGRAEPDIGFLQKLVASLNQAIVAGAFCIRELDLNLDNLKGSQGMAGEIRRLTFGKR